ncbi:MAG: PBP1A family penicillin-binding protein [Deltaproteobacteria bacterium]|nr:PBP1A family penicillin-binding protein [Nannocystaceae bacterium]
MRPAIAKKLLLAFGLLLVLGAVAAVGTIAGVFWWYGRDLAQYDAEGLRDYRPPQLTRIVSRDGELIGEIYTQRRTLIRYGEIPSHVESAFLAAEDADFYRHEGMDVPGMVRALLVNLRAGEIKQGASTITQQVVKIFLLSPERTFERKVQELLLARRVEQTFSKHEILELYLNEIYLGHGRYGIEEAARFYFAKSVRELDLGQAALLATLPKAPGRDSPLRNPELAKRRQVHVLQQMVLHELVPRAEAQPFIDGGLGLAPAEARSSVTPGAEEFVDEVREQLEAEFGAEQLPYLGARVVTTVSMDAQRGARAAVIDNLRELDVRQGYAHKLKPAKAKAKAAALALGDAPVEVGSEHVAIIGNRPAAAGLPDDGFTARVGSHEVFVRVPEGSRYDDPKLGLAEQFPVDAAIQVRILPRPSAEGDDGKPAFPAGWLLAEIAAGPEASVVVADVRSGEVLAMIGGTDYELGDFNRAARALRQPGSSFKPFVYGAALHSRQLTAASLVSDSPEIYEKWRPTNFEVDVYRGDIRLREALAHSVNTIAIKLVDRLGVDAVKDFARTMGISSAQPSDLSIALGTGEVTPLELLGGYMTIARGGNRIDPRMVRTISLPDGRVVTPGSNAQQVIGDDVAFVLTSMMTQVVKTGTGTKAAALGRPVAGKTGTSADHHDAWFAGFTPRTVAVAWIGFDRPRRIGNSETGGRSAVPMWVEAMKAAEHAEPMSFTPPASVSVRRIDAVSGLLAPPDAQIETLEEYFVAGTEPIDEAVPDAKATGDVLLGLYDDEAATGAVDEGQPETGEPGAGEPAEPPPTATRPTSPRAGELPSIDQLPDQLPDQLAD